MKTLLSLFVLLLFFTNSMAQNKDQTLILSILTNQTKEWNKGNISAFMQGYWDNDSLLFVGKNGPKYGFQTTLAQYYKSYPDTVTMGKLTFSILQVNPISPTHYFVLGKWMLKRSIGDVSGYFTLLFRKINHQWVIVVDHSS